MPRRSGNGGLPEPPSGTLVRELRCEHRQCGAVTRIRIPAALPEAAIHRVVCDGCHEAYTPPVPTPAGPLAGAGAALEAAWDRVLDARDAVAERAEDLDQAQIWTWASVPIAALAVVAALALIQGGSSSRPTPPPPVTRQAAGPDAKYVRGSGYSLALPSGWRQTDPPDGAAFSARSKDGLATATLWIERAPGLSFHQFERQSLTQLGKVADNPRVVDRVEGPTIEGTITELRAEAPVADGVSAPVHVTLRGAGDYRFYFTTVEQPGAEPQLGADIETMHASLRPDVTAKGVKQTTETPSP